MMNIFVALCYPVSLRHSTFYILYKGPLFTIVWGYFPPDAVYYYKHNAHFFQNLSLSFSYFS